MFGFRDGKKVKEIEEFFSVMSGEGDDAKVFVRSQRNALLRIIKENKNSSDGLIATRLAAETLFHINMQKSFVLQGESSAARAYALELKQPIYVVVLICGKLIISAERQLHNSELEALKTTIMLADGLDMPTAEGSEVGWREWVSLPPSEIVKSLL